MLFCSYSLKRSRIQRLLCTRERFLLKLKSNLGRLYEQKYFKRFFQICFFQYLGGRLLIPVIHWRILSLYLPTSEQMVLLLWILHFLYFVWGYREIDSSKKGFIFKSMNAITIRSVKAAHTVLINRLAMSTNFRQTAWRIRLLFFGEEVQKTQSGI